MFPMICTWDSTCFPTAGSIARLDLTRGLEAMQLVLGAREVLRPAGGKGSEGLQMNSSKWFGISWGKKILKFSY